MMEVVFSPKEGVKVIGHQENLKEEKHKCVKNLFYSTVNEIKRLKIGS